MRSRPRFCISRGCENDRVNQGNLREAIRQLRCRLNYTMATKRMADRSNRAQIQLQYKVSHVTPELFPCNGGTAATPAMAAQIQRNNVKAVHLTGDLIPTTAMKSGRVHQQQNRVARITPLCPGKLYAVDERAMQARCRFFF